MAETKGSLEKIADAVGEAVQAVAVGVGLASEPEPQPKAIRKAERKAMITRVEKAKKATGRIKRRVPPSAN